MGDVHYAPEFVDFSYAWAPNRLRAELPARRDFLGRDMFFEGARIYVDAPTGAGKSMFVLGIAHALAEGASFGPWEGSGEPVRVLFVDFEMGSYEMQRRLHYFASPNLAVICGDDLPQIGHLHAIDTPPGMAQIEAALNSLEAEVLIVDNLYGACEGSLLGGADRAGGWAAHERLIPFANKLSTYNKLSIWVQHSNDAGLPYGDKRLSRQMTAHLHIDRVPPEDTLRLQVSTRKNRMGGRPDPWITSWTPEGGWRLLEASKKTVRRADCRGHMHAFLAAIADCDVVDRPDHPDVPRNASARLLEDARKNFDAFLGDMSAADRRRTFNRLLATAQRRRLIIRVAEFVWPID